MHTFGQRLDGVHYRERPGAYAVALDDRQRVMLVYTQQQWFLPGGGLQPGESSAHALRREVLEETGHAVAAMEEIGRARQYCPNTGGTGYLEKLCTYFRVELGGTVKAPTEPDHLPRWIEAPRAVDLLSLEADAWAVRQAVAADPEPPPARAVREEAPVEPAGGLATAPPDIRPPGLWKPPATDGRATLPPLPDRRRSGAPPDHADG